MKRKFWLLRDALSQILALILIGLALLWVLRHRSDVALLYTATWFRLLIWITTILYIILSIGTITGLSGRSVLRRFDPGDTESLKKLNRMSRFRLNRMQIAALKRTREPMERCIAWLRSRGYREAGRTSIGLVYEKQNIIPGRGFRPSYNRVFLSYRPMLNVLILDRILDECGTYLDEQRKDEIRLNTLIILTSMENDTEVLSSAAGVVNFLGSSRRGVLMPMLVDLRFGRLFYPPDQSLSGFLPSFQFFLQRRDLLSYWCSGEVRAASRNSAGQNPPRE